MRPLVANVHQVVCQNVISNGRSGRHVARMQAGRPRQPGGVNRFPTAAAGF